MGARTLAIAMLAALAGTVAAEPLQPKAQAVVQGEASAPNAFIRPEIAVPHSLSFWPQIPWGQTARCEPGEPIDTSTAGDARRPIEAAGYVDPRDLQKDCDSFSHGTVTVDGRRVVFLLVDPQGGVRLE